jgi:hypothetical protein
MFYEHRVRLNGEWENYICTAEADQSQPCPICEGGDRPSLVGVMTVIVCACETVCDKYDCSGMGSPSSDACGLLEESAEKLSLKLIPRDTPDYLRPLVDGSYSEEDASHS